MKQQDHDVSCPYGHHDNTASCNQLRCEKNSYNLHVGLLISFKEPITSYGMRPGREADHSPPSSVEVKKAWSCISTPPICLHGVVLN
jgi:hypothetical protein